MYPSPLYFTASKKHCIREDEWGGVLEGSEHKESVADSWLDCSSFHQSLVLYTFLIFRWELISQFLVFMYLECNWIRYFRSWDLSPPTFTGFTFSLLYWPRYFRESYPSWKVKSEGSLFIITSHFMVFCRFSVVCVLGSWYFHLFAVNGWFFFLFIFVLLCQLGFKSWKKR